MWFLFQGAIVILVVWANETWQWLPGLPGHFNVAIWAVAMGAAWLATKIAMAIINVTRGKPSNSLAGW